jgi:hypothetical protein
LKGRYRLGGLALLVACAALWAAAAAGASGAASTFTVAGFGDGNGNVGCSPPDSNRNSLCPTLRAAVVAASKQANSPTIYLQSGTYQLAPGNGGQLDLASSMSIIGAGPGGASGTTIQQTDGLNRVLEVDGESTLSGLEITGGHASPPWSSGGVAYGGGILVLGQLNLQNSLVTGNQAIGAPGPALGEAGDAATGGGIEYGATAAAGSQIVDSTVSDNSAIGGRGGAGGSAGGRARGAGIASESPGSFSVQNSTISGNAATGGAGGGGASAGGTGGSAQGGGIFNEADLTVTASTIASNVATGGAQGAGPTPSSSTGGSADGGGLFSSGVGDQIANSTFFANGADGGAASTGGTPGSGIGGGMEIGSHGNDIAVDIENDTIDANHATSAVGNLYVNLTFLEPLTIQDTIVAAGTPNNCARFGGASSSRESFNLEDDAAGTCVFSAVNHDLVGVDPALATALADNGGPTQTLAPIPGSPVLGAGGTCSVTVDQRGEPRHTPCDIGAFESQPPVATAVPTITGKAARGQTLICNQGAWSGDGPLSYAFAWLRNGAAIPGVSTNTYVVGAPDAGQTLACRVTAAYYGSASAASSFVIVPSNPVITVLKTSSKPTQLTLSLGCRGPDGTRCKGSAVVTVVEKRRGGKVVGFSSSAATQAVTVGQQKYSIRARHTVTLHIALNHKVAHWLKQFTTVPARLAVNQTTAAGTSTVATRHLKIRRSGTSKRG